MKCKHCGQEFIIEKHKNKIYCNKICQVRYNGIKRYNKLKNDEDYKRKKREGFKQWYLKNKQRQKENTLRDYYRHKEHWKRREHNHAYRYKILNLFGNKCAKCLNSKNLIIKNLDYEKISRKDNWTENIKKHVIVLCRSCNGK